MVRKPALNTSSLKTLGIDKLAQLVLDEAERNTAFRRQVKAAIAGQSGPEAIAKVIDRRLSGLERARAFIEWDRTRAFRDDLQSIVDITVSELGPAAPALASDRLLRFIVTHEAVFERVDDSSGSVQDVYYQAIAAAGDLAPQLKEAEADLLPEKIMAALGETTHGYLADLSKAVTPHLPQQTLIRWDADLAQAVQRRETEEAGVKSDGWFYSMTSQWNRMRQTIAEARGDLDLLIGLEAQKPPHMQATLDIAARLLEAGRAAEALDWVRRPGKYQCNDPDKADTDPGSPERVKLEARILEAVGDKDAAQALRWRSFEIRPSADILREYLKNLPDFEDIEALDRAFDLASQHADPTTALQFFLDWPRYDLAAGVIVTNRNHWDGRDYYTLPKIAKLLEHEYPLAATILYRALLDDILARARSKAYSHGAKHLKQLALLAGDAEADPARPQGIPDHATYLAGLKKAHPRKSGFWTLAEEAK